MTRFNPPPDWVKEWTAVAAKLAAVGLFLIELARVLLALFAHDG